MNTPSKKTVVPIDMSNDYARALVKTLQQFLIEECTGQVYAELRLAKKLEAIREVFPDDRARLCRGHYPITLTTEDTELIFTNGK